MITKNTINTTDTTDIIYDCIIVGAGAAGLFFAASMAGVAEKTDTAETAGTGKRLILEKTGRPGQKLLLSGGGMCNITHGGSIKDFVSHYSQAGTNIQTSSSGLIVADNDGPTSVGNSKSSGAGKNKPIAAGNKIRSCLYKHNNLELMKMCEDAGVPLTIRDDWKVFPASMKANDILDMLLAKATSNGFELRCGEEVTAIDPETMTVFVSRVTGNNDGSRALRARKLIIATGGASYPATGSDGAFMKILKRDLGINTIELKPALAPIYVENYPYRDISGISFEDIEVSCADKTMRGPMLLTHRNFSGPVMLHMSQYVKPGELLRINYLPDMNVSDVFRKLKADQPGEQRGIAGYLSKEFGLPKAFTEKMFADPTRKFSSVGPKEMENVAHLMTDRTHTVSGTGGWNEAMVTAGGVDLDEVDLKTMSLVRYPNIRVIGEALDINGDTGGYNLQFAYSSAMAAL